MTVDGPADQPTPAPRPAPPAPPGAAAADAGEASATTKKHHPEGNFKDTIESILVAFILAFVFRAFVVEAFVIPTGSMAPTLLGAHMRFTCTDCGYAYTVNYSTHSAGGDIQIPSKVPGGLVEKVYCPNCGYPVPQKSNQEPDRADVPVHYGDRILVLKYRYLLAGPRRWDVVVFKTPDTSVESAAPYTTNYIKRLVGLPGETVMLLDGDVYVSQAPKLDHDVLVNGLRSIVQDPTVPPAPGPDADAARAVRDYLATFRIQRKPGYAQDAVWRNVYDNDYVPHLPADRREGDYQRPAAAWAQPWQPAPGGAGWDVGQNLPAGLEGRTRRFTFSNGAGGGALAFNPAANEKTFPLTDFLAYDQIAKGTPPLNPVRDLRLGVTYERQSGDGPFRMSLAKGDDRFTLEVTPGKARLVRQRASFAAPGGWEAVGAAQDVAVPELAGGRAVRLQIQNVDRRVAVRVDGREVLATGTDYDPTAAELCQLLSDEYRHAGRRDPRTDADRRPTAEVSAERQQCTLTHVKLERDVFYINSWNVQSPDLGRSPHRGTPDVPITLGPAEYFTLGDNSPISGDARSWPSDPIRLPGEDLYVEAGRVPGRFLLGKAFFVYWPAGHRPYSDGAWGLVPNFGEMRVIQ